MNRLRRLWCALRGHAPAKRLYEPWRMWERSPRRRTVSLDCSRCGGTVAAWTETEGLS